MTEQTEMPLPDAQDGVAAPKRRTRTPKPIPPVETVTEAPVADVVAGPTTALAQMAAIGAANAIARQEAVRAAEASGIRIARHFSTDKESLALNRATGWAMQTGKTFVIFLRPASEANLKPCFLVMPEDESQLVKNAELVGRIEGLAS
jgi:hypothetical protein